MKYFDWKPEVGMEVFVVPYDKRHEPYADTITRVGRLYFYADRYKIKFHNDTKARVEERYCSDRICYRSKQDYEVHKACNERRKLVERHIGKLTEEQVDTVYEWIKDKTI